MELNNELTNEEENQEGSSLRENIQQQANNVEERIEEARQMIDKYNQKVVDIVTEKPFLAIAGAFAVGFVIGKLAAHRWFV